MLKRIESEVLSESLIFENGLNVIAGDDLASNSIGKSSSLLLVDFALGGNTYTEDRLQIVQELGYHKFEFTYIFNDVEYKFERDTENPRIVKHIKKDSVEELSLQKYTSKLKMLYGIDNLNLSFRQIVGSFSRIAGKDQIIMSKPLHSDYYKKEEDAVLFLVKLFDKYSVLDNADKLRKESGEKLKTFKTANKYSLIKSVKKSDLKQAVNELEMIKGKISKIDTAIKDGYREYDNINNEIIQGIKEDYRELSDVEKSIKYRIKRMSKVSGATNRELNQIKKYFSELNEERFEKVSEFQKSINSYFNNQIEEERKSLQSQLSIVDKQLDSLSSQIDEYLKIKKKGDSSIFIKERIKLENELNKRGKAISNYELSKVLTVDSKEKTESFKQLVENSIVTIVEDTNKKLEELNITIYGETVVPPHLDMQLKKYGLVNEKDTGTGTQHTNIVLFDMVMKDLTNIPVLIHDSIVHKNISKTTVEELVKLYNKSDRQIFISIDEIYKYEDSVIKIINDSVALRLSKDKLLFIRDWRKAVDITT